MLDVLQSQRIKDGLVKELNLPQSIIIASFDSPVYATNFSLRISKNVAYKLEGKKNQSEMPMNPVILFDLQSCLSIHSDYRTF